MRLTRRGRVLRDLLAFVAVAAFVWYISGVDTAWWTDNPLPIR